MQPYAWKWEKKIVGILNSPVFGHTLYTSKCAKKWISFQIRAVTILDLYRQGKLDLHRVGLEEGKYTRTDLVLTLTRVFLARVLFFPILPITMFLKVKYSKFKIFCFDFFKWWIKTFKVIFCILTNRIKPKIISV